MRAKSFVVGAAALLTTIALGVSTAPAAYGVQRPGLLRPRDLPGALQATVRGLAARPSSMAPEVDPATCTETPVPVDVGLGQIIAAFTGATTTEQTAELLSESVMTFRTAKAAQKAYAKQSTNSAAAVTCGSVGYIPTGATAPTVTVQFGSVKFPVVGDGTFATNSYNASGVAVGFNSVTFVSGNDVVKLVAPIAASAPTVAELKTIAARAEQRLSG